MQTCFTTLTGKTITLEVEAPDIPAKVKANIQDNKGDNKQRLSFIERHLEDETTLFLYNIQKESILKIVLRLIGGYYVSEDMHRFVFAAVKIIQKNENAKTTILCAKNSEEHENGRFFIKVVWIKSPRHFQTWVLYARVPAYNADKQYFFELVQKQRLFLGHRMYMNVLFERKY